MIGEKITWSEAPTEVIRLAQDIIGKYHPDLRDANVGFLMRSKRGKSQGKFVLGKASKVPERLHPYLDYHFIIWLSEEDWPNLDANQKRALIDHELSHCSMIGDRVKMVAHDFEEFNHIVQRYGLWLPHLMLAGRVLQEAAQAELPGVTHSGKVDSISPETIIPDNPHEIDQEQRDAQVDNLLDDFLKSHTEDDTEDE